MLNRKPVQSLVSFSAFRIAVSTRSGSCLNTKVQARDVAYHESISCHGHQPGMFESRLCSVNPSLYRGHAEGLDSNRLCESVNSPRHDSGDTSTKGTRTQSGDQHMLSQIISLNASYQKQTQPDAFPHTAGVPGIVVACLMYCEATLITLRRQRGGRVLKGQ